MVQRVGESDLQGRTALITGEGEGRQAVCAYQRINPFPVFAETFVDPAYLQVRAKA